MRARHVTSFFFFYGKEKLDTYTRCLPLRWMAKKSGRRRAEREDQEEEEEDQEEEEMVRGYIGRQGNRVE